MTKPVWSRDRLSVRTLRTDDLEALEAFACSSGPDWETEVEDQVRGPLPRRYLAGDRSELDPRMLVVLDEHARIVAVAAHHVEPRDIVRDGDIEEIRPTYVEVVAVSLHARRTLVDIGASGRLTVGEFVYDVLVQDAISRPGRAPLIFGRVDKRHTVSLSFCDSVGLTIEREDQMPPYVQRWGDL